MRLFPAVLMLAKLLLATSAAAGAVSDGSLARSSRLPFTVERDTGRTTLLRIGAVEAGSTAARAGLRAGDVVLRINCESYERPIAGRRLLEHGTGGSTIVLELAREGRTRKLRFEAPPAPYEDIPGVTSHYGSLMTTDGLRLRTITTRPNGADATFPHSISCSGCPAIPSSTR